MASHPKTVAPGDAPAARLLRDSRFEIIPVRGIEDRMKGLPPGSTVTVTASPTYGLLRTVEVTEWLVAHGYHAVPHLSARMVNGRNELAGLVSRLEDAGIDQAFVIGGDASPPAGPYHQAARSWRTWVTPSPGWAWAATRRVTP